MMPNQINGIALTDNGDGTYDIQFGDSPYGQQGRPIAELFDRSSLNRDLGDSATQQALVGSINAYLLSQGYDSLTSAAIADVQAKEFSY